MAYRPYDKVAYQGDIAIMPPAEIRQLLLDLNNAQRVTFATDLKYGPVSIVDRVAYPTNIINRNTVAYFV